MSALPWYNASQVSDPTCKIGKATLKAPKETFVKKFNPYNALRNTLNNYRFSCESCCYSYSTQHQLNKHLSEHVKCNVDGCTVEAHFKIIERHREHFHASGLAKRFKWSNTPEDNEKYREERKRNFPRPERIIEKESEKQAKEQRGEIIAFRPIKKNLFVKKKKDDFNYNFHRKKKFDQWSNYNGKRVHKLLSTNSQVIQKIKAKKKMKLLQLFKPKVFSEAVKVDPSIKDEEEIFSDNDRVPSPTLSDSEIKKEDSKVFDNSAQITTSKIPSFFTGEISSGSDDDGPPLEVPITKPLVSSALNSIVAAYGDDSSSGQENTNDASKKENQDATNVASSAQASSKRKRRRHHKKRISQEDTTPNKKAHTELRSTTKPLYKQPINTSASLLAKDFYAEDLVKHKNWIFQCIRYIVNNNFFLDE